MKTNYTDSSGRKRDAAAEPLITPSPALANPAQIAAAGLPYSGARLALSVRETAATLGVSEKTVRRLVNRKMLRASRALRHLLIPTKEIQRFLDETTSR